MRSLLFFFICFIGLSFNEPIRSYIKEDVLLEYFGPICNEPKPGDIATLVGRDQNDRMKKMQDIFKKGRYFDLNDSVVRCLLEKNENPNFWYATELEKLPSSYYHIELFHEVTPILAYYHVAIVNENGRIERVEKYGYGM